MYVGINDVAIDWFMLYLSNWYFSVMFGVSSSLCAPPFFGNRRDLFLVPSYSLYICSPWGKSSVDMTLLCGWHLTAFTIKICCHWCFKHYDLFFQDKKLDNYPIFSLDAFSDNERDMQPRCSNWFRAVFWCAGDQSITIYTSIVSIIRQKWINNKQANSERGKDRASCKTINSCWHTILLANFEWILWMF